MKKQLARQLRAAADRLDPPTMRVDWGGVWTMSYDTATLAAIAHNFYFDTTSRTEDR